MSIPDKSVLVLGAFVCFPVMIGTLTWLDARIERHMRDRHPVHAANFFPILPWRFLANADEREHDRRRAEGRRRFEQFIASGGLESLGDSSLERLLTKRKIARIVCNVSATILLASIFLLSR